MLVAIATDFNHAGSQVGFSRPVQEEDIWRFDKHRLVAYKSAILQEYFYQRCPDELRPAHLRSSPLSMFTTFERADIRLRS